MAFGGPLGAFGEMPALVRLCLLAAAIAQQSARAQEAQKDEIRSIYRRFNPDKLAALPRLFEKYEGAEQELLDSVREKYGVAAEEGGARPERIRVIDGVFDAKELEIVSGAWRHAPYRWGEQDTLNAPPAGTVLELELDDPAVTTAGDKIGPLGDLGLDVTGGAGERITSAELSSWTPWRAYVNLFRRGDHPQRHRDTIGFPSVTVLLYADDSYDYVTCGGETLFFSSARGDATMAVTARPGRAAIFDGEVFHTARPPLPGCAMPRLTLAIKYCDPRHAQAQRQAADRRAEQQAAQLQAKRRATGGAEDFEGSEL